MNNMSKRHEDASHFAKNWHAGGHPMKVKVMSDVASFDPLW